MVTEKRECASYTKVFDPQSFNVITNTTKTCALLLADFSYPSIFQLLANNYLNVVADNW